MTSAAHKRLHKFLVLDLNQWCEDPEICLHVSGTGIPFMAAVAEVIRSMALQAYTVPVVGVWVSGVASASHPLVWAACLKFLASGQLQDKALMADGAFLLLLYQTGLRGPFKGLLSAGAITQALLLPTRCSHCAWCSPSIRRCAKLILHVCRHGAAGLL